MMVGMDISNRLRLAVFHHHEARRCLRGRAYHADKMALKPSIHDNKKIAGVL